MNHEDKRYLRAPGIGAFVAAAASGLAAHFWLADGWFLPLAATGGASVAVLIWLVRKI